ncbi:FeoB-associated Cys-rich membrane protein [Spirosoma telluris]
MITGLIHYPLLIVHYTLKAMQELIIFLVFASALAYLGRRIYRSFSKKQAGCGKGCGCAADAKATLLPTEK